MGGRKVLRLRLECCLPIFLMKSTWSCRLNVEEQMLRSFALLSSALLDFSLTRLSLSLRLIMAIAHVRRQDGKWSLLFSTTMICHRHSRDCSLSFFCACSLGEADS